MRPYAFEDFTPAGREQLRAALALAAMRRHHTPACVEAREDPGASCICRPPACVEPKNPTAVELRLAKAGAR